MIRIDRFAPAVASLVAVGLAVAPAAAQYNDYVAPKLLQQGKTTHDVAGSGTVIVQVQVNADGSHHAIRVIRSTNHADDAAALDIANSSQYHPARRNGKAVPAYYDFTLRFNGKSVAASGESGPAESGEAGTIGRMIRAGNYQGAKSAADTYLASTPGDAAVLQELATAQYYLKDYAASAATFAKVSAISPQFKNVAAQAFANGAVQSQNNAEQAVDFAKRAVALAPNGNSYYALGVAELTANQAQQAAVDLKRSHDLAFADSKTPKDVRVNIDGYLLTAYTKAGDTANAQAISAELSRLAPNSTMTQRVMGNQLLQQANAAAQAGKHDDAEAAYEKAAATGDPTVSVTAYVGAAFQESAIQQAAKTPNYAKMKSYADKALAIKADDPQANFAEGVALAGQWATSGGQNADLKSQAMNALNKAKSLAQAANSMALVLQIDNFMKNTFKS